MPPIEKPSRHYFPPTVSRVDICVKESRTDHTDEHMDAGMRTLSYKFITSETVGSSHIFWLHLRNYRRDDPEFETLLRANLERTFWEDNHICSAIQEWQDATGERQQVSVPFDRAPRLALRMIEESIGADRAG
jgi:vanillate O-demethylase monooxygenase subunit